MMNLYAIGLYIFFSALILAKFSQNHLLDLIVIYCLFIRYYTEYKYQFHPLLGCYFFVKIDLLYGFSVFFTQQLWLLFKCCTALN